MRTLFKILEEVHFLATSQENTALIFRWAVWASAVLALLFGYAAPIFILMAVKTAWVFALVLSKSRYQKKERERRAELDKLQHEPWPGMATAEGQPNPNQK
jgi:hypothetical protein